MGEVCRVRDSKLLTSGTRLGSYEITVAAQEGRASLQSEIRVVLNWFDELRRLAPRGEK